MKQGYITHYVVPNKDVQEVNYGIDNQRFLVATKPNTVFLYTIGDKKRPVPFISAKFTPTCAVFNTDGTIIYAGSNEGKIVAYQMHSNSPKYTAVAHSLPVNAIVYNKNSSRIVTGSNDKIVKVWSNELKFITSVSHHASQITALATSGSSSMILSGDAQGYVYLWDSNKPKLPPQFKLSLRSASKCSVQSLDFDSTGSLFVASTSDGHISVWDINGPTLLQSYNVKTNCVRFCPSQPLILAFPTDSLTPLIFSLQSSSLLFSFEGHKAPGGYCAWDPSGKEFTTIDREGITIVWRLPKERFEPVWISKTQKPIEKIAQPLSPQKTAVSPTEQQQSSFQPESTRSKPEKIAKEEAFPSPKKQQEPAVPPELGMPPLQQINDPLMLILQQLNQLNAMSESMMQRLDAQEERINYLTQQIEKKH